MTYFFGERNNLGTVSRVPAVSFAELLAWVQPVPLRITRQEYHSLPKPQRDKLKRVRYLTPAAFAQSPSPRQTEHAVAISLLFLDLDESESEFSKRLLAGPVKLGFPHLIYHTATSKPETPRLRIMVAADQLPVEKYADAVTSLADALGITRVNTESMVAIQPMFFPVTFSGDDPFDSPIVQASTEGSPFGLSSITGKAQPLVERTTRGDGNRVDDLDWLRLPVDGLGLNDVAQALVHIDPDLPYSEWLTVAAALRHQWSKEPQSSEAFDLFVEWSQKGAKFASREDCAAKWNSLKPHPKGRLPITARSLLHMAERGGWKPLSTTERLIAACKMWILAPERRMIDLTTYGAKKIAAVPLITVVDRGILVQTLIDKLAVYSVKVTKADVLADIAKLEAKQRSFRSEIDPISESEMPQWARGICYVASQDLFYRRITGQSWSPKVFDSVHGAYLVAPGEAKPKIRPQDYVLNVLRIPRADDTRYDPRSPDGYTLEGARRLLNIYLPEYPAPDARRVAEAEEILQQHVAMLFKEPELQTLMLDWMAFVVQNPGHKVRWAPIIQGGKGCGKTTLAEMMATVLGRRNVFALDGTALMDTGWNEWCEKHQVVFMEEIRVVGESRTKVMNKLKPLITNDWIMVSQRFCDARQVPNVANYLLLTNYQDAMPMTEDERRYCVMFSQIQSREQIQAIPRGYFKNIYRQLAENAGGFRAALETRTISDTFDADGHAPLTAYQSVMGQYSASPVQAAVLAVLESGNKLVGESWISMSHLLAAVVRECKLANGQNVAAVLREMGYAPHNRAYIGRDRSQLWVRHGRKTPGEKELAQALKEQEEAETRAFLS